MNKKWRFSLVMLLLMSGCAGLGSPFIKLRPDYSTVPETELRNAAAAIEKAVAQGEREPKFDPFSGVVLDTPEITQAIRTRVIRNPLLQELLDSGFAYEQKSGTVAILRSRDYKQATTSRQRDQHALLVMSENQNRWTLYEGVLEASNWPSSALGAVQDSFYEARKALMKSGQKYEDESGNIAVQ